MVSIRSPFFNRWHHVVTKPWRYGGAFHFSFQTDFWNTPFTILAILSPKQKRPLFFRLTKERSFFLGERFLRKFSSPLMPTNFAGLPEKLPQWKRGCLLGPCLRAFYCFCLALPSCAENQGPGAPPKSFSGKRRKAGKHIQYMQINVKSTDIHMMQLLLSQLCVFEA